MLYRISLCHAMVQEELSIEVGLLLEFQIKISFSFLILWL